MRLGKEIERLRQRVHKLSIEKDPPTLRMVIVKDDKSPQELSTWDLRVWREKGATINLFSKGKKNFISNIRLASYLTNKL